MPERNNVSQIRAAPLQVLPTGLLGFLQLKNGGQFPQELARDLIPELDLLNWYMQTNAELITQSTSPGVATNNPVTLANLTVPQGEFWYVSSYIAQITAGAGGTVVNGYAVVWRNDAAVNQAVECSDPLTLGAALTGFAQLKELRGIILKPGDSLGGFLQTVTVAACTFVGKAFISRLKI